MKKNWFTTKVATIIGICIFFVIIACFALFFVYYDYSYTRYSKQSAEIVEAFSPWCSSRRYVFYDLDAGHLELEQNNRIRDVEVVVKKAFPDINSFSKNHSFLYKNNHIFFSGLEKTNNHEKHYSIFKTSKDFSHIERIETIKVINNESTIKYSYGFDNKGYFKINNEYIVFDFETEKAETTDFLDEENLLGDQDKYMRYLKISRSKCKTSKDGICEFYYDNELKMFDENYIEENYRNAMKKYNFKISWQISFPSGITTFAYFGNGKGLSFSDCVLVSYNRNAHSIIDYQLFTGVSSVLELSNLYPDIDLLGDIG